MRFLLLLVAISGCGCMDTTSGPSIHPELRGYVEDFLIDCDGYGADLSDLAALRYVDFAEQMEGSDVGICWIIRSKVLQRTWATAIEVERMENETMQRALMYHELGHCILNLDHRPDTMMAAVLLDEKTYLTNWNTLVEDLCHRYQ